MSQILYLNEARINKLLNWTDTYKAIEISLTAQCRERAIQNPRSVIRTTNGVLYSMPGFLQNETYGALGCKLVTSFTNNPNRIQPLPSVLAHILLFNEETGELKAVLAGTEITTWRTAAASAVATKYLHFRSSERKNNILSIFGAGIQGRIHAIAFQHFFKFKEVRIWNHNKDKAEKLVQELIQLNNINGCVYKAYDDVKICAEDADVIVTVTNSDKPFLELNYLKPNVHVNAVGVGNRHFAELESAVYEAGDVYSDYLAGSKQELDRLENFVIEFKGEIGELITGSLPMPISDRITIFQSSGMAIEDCAMARLIYDRYMEQRD